MTRQEKIQALDDKYAPKFQIQLDKIQLAEKNMNDDRAVYKIKLDAINAYFDALEEQQRINNIVAQGEPII